MVDKINTIKSETRRVADQSWHGAFLSALEKEHGHVGYACKAVNKERATVYNHRKWFKDFAKAWEDIVNTSTETLEQEAFRRAKEQSDVLLIFLLKSRRPDVYRDNVKQEHSGEIQIKVVRDRNPIQPA